MKNKVIKNYIILMFLFLIIVLAGCTKKEQPGTGIFKGGIEGVSISFVNLAPPSSFSQDTSPKVKILLKNKGETKVQTGNAKVRIFGITHENFGLPNTYKTTLGPLEPAGEFTKEGGEQEVDLGNIKYKLSIINQETFTLRARLCYPYQTIAKTDVCVQSLITQESRGEVCSLIGEKIKSGDGY